MVEVKVDVWVPSVIVKEMVNRKSFVVKPLKYLSWNDGGEKPKPNRTVGLSSIRPTPPTVSVKSFGLMYTVWFKSKNQYLEFKHDAIRPSGETIAKLVSQNTNEVNVAINPQMSLSLGENGEKEVPEEHNREDDSRNRKRGEVEHTSDLSEAAATESVSSLTATALEQTEAGTEEFTVLPESSEEVNKNQVMQIVVLPFAKELSFWKELQTREVFQRAPPQAPHFSPLVGESEVFREGQALGLMLTFSKLVESVKDLEPDVLMSQLDSLKASFAKLKKHGFNVSAPLTRINKLLALKDRQQKAIEMRKMV
ncbi:hypothetical protein DY000_02050900 [Brassica cretica]|uniref:Uncharacterized protein n=1 Tax=Brassica cretica TaxID=69181 RepID=A0ABQ7F202_BRACR|nr:hypothetical protein DY000_02050900 [Brassica cretica]